MDAFELILLIASMLLLAGPSTLLAVLAHTRKAAERPRAAEEAAPARTGLVTLAQPADSA